MHPSWRDLVVERLVIHQPSRRTFLQRCGLAGFLLALSSAGGATGDRELPLLRSDEDWQALSQSVLRVLRSERFADWKVLNTLQTVLLASTEARPAAGSTAPQPTRLADTVLTTLRKLWAAGEQCPTADTLEWYYRVSESIAPLPSGPDLRAIWKETWDAARKDIANFDPKNTEIELDGMLEWILAATTIAENEPRFLRQIFFPAHYHQAVTPMLPLLKERVELRFDLDYEDDCTEEEGNMDTISVIAAQLAEHFEELAEDALALAKLAKDNELRVERIRRDLEDRATEEEREEREKNYGRSPRTRPSETDRDPLETPIDVGELFRDL